MQMVGMPISAQSILHRSINAMRTQHKLRVQDRAVGEIQKNPRNPRTHSPAQIRRIADSISRFGWTNPILIDGKDRILAGHGRVEAAKLIGLGEVPTIRVGDLTPAELRAYVIADNRLAELAGWDTELLALELGELATLDLDFDVRITGFDTAEIDLLIADSTDRTRDPQENVAPAPDRKRPPVSKSGDLWLMGRHRLLCDDARNVDSYRRLLGEERAQTVFTDPPYNVRIAGHVSGLGRVKHGDFAMASGEMTEAEFAAFLETVFRHLAAFTGDGSLHYIFIDWRHLYELLSAGRQAFARLANLCVWAKTNAGMGSLYRSQHELIAVFKNGQAAHVNNVMLGRHGRNRTNLWVYAGVNTFGTERDQILALHPTVKPVELIADAILDCTHRGAIVLDPFCGSGSTIIAAQRTGRRAFAMEIDPGYTDTAIRRWQTLTGEQAVHAATGLPFDDEAAAAHEDPDAVSRLLSSGGKAARPGGRTPALKRRRPVPPTQTGPELERKLPRDATHGAGTARIARRSVSCRRVAHGK